MLACVLEILSGTRIRITKAGECSWLDTEVVTDH